MPRAALKTLSIDELLSRFVEDVIGYGESRASGNSRKANRLYDDSNLVHVELKSRGGDAERALLKLIAHDNAYVRSAAAARTLHLDITLARAALEKMSDNPNPFIRADAGFALKEWDKGTLKLPH